MMRLVLALCLASCAPMTPELRRERARTRALDEACGKQCRTDPRASFDTLAKFRDPAACVCWTPGGASWEVDLPGPALTMPQQLFVRAYR